MKFRFETRYFLVAVLIFSLGITAATTFHQIRFIRGSASDIIATMFVFFSILSFIRIRHFHLAVLTLCFAYLIELGQFFHFSDRLGMKRGSLISILLGNSFSFADIACYTLGVCIAMFIVSKLIQERLPRNA